MILILMLGPQEPSIEEILRELERLPDPNNMVERIRALSGNTAPRMADRVVENLGREELSETSRSVVRSLAESGDERVIDSFNKAITNEELPVSRRLDLAESLAGAKGIEAGGFYEEIAMADEDPVNRLRAVNLLRTEDPEKAEELAPDVMEDVELKTLESPGILRQVELSARHGDKDARELLRRAMEDEDLPEETRLAAAESLGRLEGVARAETFLREFSGMKVDGHSPEESTDHGARTTEREAREEEPATAVKSNIERKVRKRKRPRTESSSNVNLNLTILSFLILLGAALVLLRRRA